MQARSNRRCPVVPAGPEPAEIQSLLLNLSPLSGLEWEPLQMRMSALASALQGNDSVTRADLTRLRTWATRWTSLPEQVRDFYRAELPASWAGAALYKLLETQEPILGKLRGDIERAWLDRYGEPPKYSLSNRR